MNRGSKILLSIVIVLFGDNAGQFALSEASDRLWVAERQSLAHRFGKLRDSTGSTGLGTDGARLSELEGIITQVQTCKAIGPEESIEKCRYAYRLSYLHFLICVHLNAKRGTPDVYGVEHGQLPKCIAYRWEFYYALIDSMDPEAALGKICDTEGIALSDYEALCGRWREEK